MGEERFPIDKRKRLRYILTMKNMLTGAVKVTFRRLRSGRVWEARFELGADNKVAILREAWNTQSEILSVCAA